MISKETMPIVTFSYFGILEIDKLYEILCLSKSDPEAFDAICKSYSVISHKHNKNHISVNIHEIVYSDIGLYAPAYTLLNNTYQGYIKRYGYEIVSKVIVPDPYGIRAKVERILQFIMNEIYEVDEMEVHFKVPGFMKPPSSIPEIIYSVLKSKFEITHEKLADEIKQMDVDPNLRAIQIKKRSESNE